MEGKETCKGGQKEQERSEDRWRKDKVEEGGLKERKGG